MSEQIYKGKSLPDTLSILPENLKLFYTMFLNSQENTISKVLSINMNTEIKNSKIINALGIFNNKK